MAAQYIGSYVLISRGSGLGISILKIKGRVGSHSSELKTIPVAKGAYEIVYPLSPSMKLKIYIQRRLAGTYFKKGSFLSKRQLFEKIFEINWAKL